MVYCRAGRRSETACKLMEQLGFKDLNNLKGGITEWKNIMKPINQVVNYSFFVILLSFLISCQTNESDTRQVVSPEEMKELKALDTVQFIDVRTLEEFRNEHIKGAQNLVYDDDFKDKIDQLDKSKPVAVYCRTGRRSEECSKIFSDAGFKKFISWMAV